MFDFGITLRFGGAEVEGRDLVVFHNADELNDRELGHARFVGEGVLVHVFQAVTEGQVCSALTQGIGNTVYTGDSEFDTQFDIIMESSGARNNASAWFDRTNYFDWGPSSTLPTLLWLETRYGDAK